MRGYRDFSKGKEIPYLHLYSRILDADQPNFWKTMLLLIDLRNILIRLTRRNIITQLMSGHADVRLLFWNLEAFNEMVQTKPRVAREEVKEKYEVAFSLKDTVERMEDNTEFVFDRTVMNRILHYCFPESLKQPRKYFFLEKGEDKEQEKVEVKKF